jgi:hypothetical protein
MISADTYELEFELTDGYIPAWGDGSAATLTAPNPETIFYLGLWIGQKDGGGDRKFTITKIVIDDLTFEPTDEPAD